MLDGGLCWSTYGLKMQKIKIRTWHIFAHDTIYSMKQILKQTSWLILAQVLTKIIGFFYTIFLAKSLGVSDFGLFTVALAYFSILSSIAEFGFNKFLVREIAKDRLKTAELMCNVIMLRLTLTALLFAIFAIFLYLFDADKMRVSLILLAVLAVLPQSIALTFDSIFVALQKLQFSAASLLASSLLTALVGFFLVQLGFGAYGAVNALIFGQLVYVVITLVLLYRISGLHLSNIKLSVIKEAIRESLPYGILGVLGLFYFKIDTVILSYLRGSYETGLYGAAYRFLEVIVFIPASLSLSIFPRLVKVGSSKTEIKKVFKKIILYMGGIGTVVLILYLSTLPALIKFYLPSFLPSIEALKIISFSIPLIFIYLPLSQIILASEKYLKELIILTISILTLNILLNLIFIPKFGFIAASVVTVASDLLSLVVIILFIRIRIF